MEGAPGQQQPGPGAGAPSEEELRAAYAAELRRITAPELILQTAASLVNVGAYRLGLAGGDPSERDLDQVRDAIDGVRALLPILERRGGAEQLAPLRDALSQLQLAYARELQGGAPQAGRSEPPREAEQGEGGATGEGETPSQPGSGEPAAGGAGADDGPPPRARPVERSPVGPGRPLSGWRNHLREGRTIDCPGLAAGSADADTVGAVSARGALRVRSRQPLAEDFI